MFSKIPGLCFYLCGCDTFHHTSGSGSAKLARQQQRIIFTQTLMQLLYCWGCESATAAPESFMYGIAKAVSVCGHVCPYVCERGVNRFCIAVHKGVLNHCSTNGLPLGRHGFLRCCDRHGRSIAA